MSATSLAAPGSRHRGLALPLRAEISPTERQGVSGFLPPWLIHHYKGRIIHRALFSCILLRFSLENHIPIICNHVIVCFEDIPSYMCISYPPTTRYARKPTKERFHMQASSKSSPNSLRRLREKHLISSHCKEPEQSPRFAVHDREKQPTSHLKKPTINHHISSSSSSCRDSDPP